MALNSNIEKMFDQESFTDEITNTSEAKSAVAYLAHNEGKFRRELNQEGLAYEEVEEIVRQVWTNLLKSCQRVSYSDSTVIRKSKEFNFK
jgi:hypothetical protein